MTQVVTHAKTSAFTNTQRQLARVAIVQLLVSKTTCISGDFPAELPLSRTSVTQHIQELKALGLIRGEVDGLTVCYRPPDTYKGGGPT